MYARLLSFQTPMVRDFVFSESSCVVEELTASPQGPEEEDDRIVFYLRYIQNLLWQLYFDFHDVRVSIDNQYETFKETIDGIAATSLSFKVPQPVIDVTGLAIMRLRGILAYRAGRWEEALCFLNGVVTNCCTDPSRLKETTSHYSSLIDVLIMLAECYTNLNRCEEGFRSMKIAADIIHQQMDRSGPVDANEMENEGDSGAYDIGPKLYSMAMKTIASYYGIAKVLTKMKLFKFADEWFKRAISAAKESNMDILLSDIDELHTLSLQFSLSEVVRTEDEVKNLSVSSDCLIQDCSQSLQGMSMFHPSLVNNRNNVARSHPRSPLKDSSEEFPNNKSLTFSNPDNEAEQMFIDVSTDDLFCESVEKRVSENNQRKAARQEGFRSYKKEKLKHATDFAMQSAATKIGAAARGYIWRSFSTSVKNQQDFMNRRRKRRSSVIKIQAAARGFICRRNVNFIRRLRAAHLLNVLNCEDIHIDTNIIPLAQVLKGSTDNFLEEMSVDLGKELYCGALHKPLSVIYRTVIQQLEERRADIAQKKEMLLSAYESERARLLKVLEEPQQPIPLQIVVATTEEIISSPKSSYPSSPTRRRVIDRYTRHECAEVRYRPKSGDIFAKSNRKAWHRCRVKRVVEHEEISKCLYDVVLHGGINLRVTAFNMRKVAQEVTSVLRRQAVGVGVDQRRKANIDMNSSMLAFQHKFVSNPAVHKAELLQIRAKCATIIQKTFRRWIVYRYYHRYRVEMLKHELLHTSLEKNASALSLNNLRKGLVSMAKTIVGRKGNQTEKPFRNNEYLVMKLTKEVNEELISFWEMYQSLQEELQDLHVRIDAIAEPFKFRNMVPHSARKFSVSPPIMDVAITQVESSDFYSGIREDNKQDNKMVQDTAMDLVVAPDDYWRDRQILFAYAATLINSCVRGFLVRRKYKSLRRHRTFLARRKQLNAAAIRIQSLARGVSERTNGEFSAQRNAMKPPILSPVVSPFSTPYVEKPTLRAESPSMAMIRSNSAQISEVSVEEAVKHFEHVLAPVS